MSTTWIGAPYHGLHYVGQGITNANATPTNLALDSAYSYGVSGDAAMQAFIAPASANLTDFWLCVSSFAGTWGNTNGTLNVEIREGYNGTGIAGSTLVGAFTVTLAGTEAGWVKTTGLSIALTAGKIYTIVIGDADGGGSDYCTIVQRVVTDTSTLIGAGSPYVTADGFATAGTGTAAAVMPFVAKIGTSVVGGGLYTGSWSTITNGTYRRGNYFAPPEACTLVGVHLAGDLLHTFFGHTLELYASATAPGGATLMSFAIPTTNAGGATSGWPNRLILPAGSQIDLTAGQAYRIIILPASNLTVPRKLAGIAGADATTRTLRGVVGTLYHTYEDAGAWVDEVDNANALFPILVPRTPAAGGKVRTLPIEGN